MYWIEWVVEMRDPISSASSISAVDLQIAHCITNDSDAVVNDLLAGLGKLAVSTGLSCQVDNHRSG